MQTHTHWTDTPADARGASAAIGNFDGVHRGHRHVIDLARSHGPLGIVTFEPHPREFFAPGAPPFRLMNAKAKASRLAKLGVEHLFQLPFDAAMVAMTPEDFARQVIVEGLGLGHVVVGADFCFGKGRIGTAATCNALALKWGLASPSPTFWKPKRAFRPPLPSAWLWPRAARRTPPTCSATGTGSRAWWPHGDKRGRDLGFPTANMSIDGLHAPKFGVYAVRVDVLTGPHKGSYQGRRPLASNPPSGRTRRVSKASCSISTVIFMMKPCRWPLSSSCAPRKSIPIWAPSSPK